MNSPPIEWALLAAHAIALDVIRDRGEPDGDTLTEVIRVAYHTEHRTGRVALGVTLAGCAALAYQHFTKPAMRATNNGPAHR